MTNSRGGIYFVSFMEDQRYIKIGRAKSFRERFRHLCGDVPYNLKIELLIDVNEGTPVEQFEERERLEKEYQARFIKQHANGEWFATNNYVFAEIARLQKELDFTPFIFERNNSNQINKLLLEAEGEPDLNPE